MDVWDKDFLDLVEMTFKSAADGEIAFGELKGFLNLRYGTRIQPLAHTLMISTQANDARRGV